MELAIFLALFSLAGSFIISLIRSGQTSAANDQPEGGFEKPSVIGSQIQCSGWARNLVQGQHLWLAVEVNGIVVFKNDEINIDENGWWQATVFEASTTELDLSLFVVNDNAHREIHDVLRKGLNTPTTVTGVMRLARVDKLRLNQGAGQITGIQYE